MIKNRKKTLLYMLVFVFILAFTVHAPVHAASSESSATVVKVTETAITKKGFSKAVQAVLDQARDKATTSKPYKVKVPAGSYTMTTSLKLYSNTTLDLTDVVLTRSGASNMIHVGLWEDATSRVGVTGYYYKNISVIGGTLNGNSGSATMVKVGHCKNFTMTGTRMKNLVNGHICEIAGVNGCYFYGCTFSDQILQSGYYPQTFEALQIDVLNGDHMPGYRAEVLASKNIVVDKCTFKNVPRAVGSHSAIMNVKTSSIKITNNTFKNIASCAIQGQNWINVLISGNNITKAPQGIRIYSMRAYGSCSFYPSVVAGEGGTTTTVSDKYKKPEKNQNIVIKNNTISLSKVSDPYETTCKAGIQIIGMRIYNNTNIACGYYYLSGVTISYNKILTSGYGIRVTDSKYVKIHDNTIQTYYGQKDAIKVTGASYVTNLNYNYILVSNKNGILLTNSSKAKNVLGNSIYGVSGAAVRIENHSRAALVKYNGVLQCNSKYVRKNGGKITTHLLNFNLLPPSIQSLSLVSDNKKVKVVWEDNGGEKYRVYRKLKEDEHWTLMTVTSKTSYVDKQVESGIVYYYLIRSVSSDNKKYTSYYDHRTVWKIKIP